MASNDGLRSSFIGQTPEYIDTALNTVLDDPVLLRVAIRFRPDLLSSMCIGSRNCRRCRLDCAEANRRIAKLKLDNKDYVPKNDYLTLQTSHEELVKSAEQLKQSFRNAKVEYKSVVTFRIE